MARLATILAATLVLATLPAAAPAAAQDTPGLFCDEADATVGRVFPEAMETNDFVGFDEALCGLALLEDENPDKMEVRYLGESAGWHNHVTGEHDRLPVPLVEVTNEDSEVPFEEKPKVLFMLSIHGNEKGGREGGLRVIEDLVRDVGLSQEQPRLQEMLDRMVVLFLFPNPDGWAHEKAEYRANDACYLSATCYGDSDTNRGENAGEPGVETQNFVRVNGNGVDLNREAATVGWQREYYTALSEPAPQAYWPALKEYENLRYASDIHGMLHPADSGILFNSGSPPIACVGAEATPLPSAGPGDGEVCLREGHFVLTMLPAGQQTPREIAMSTSLAQDIEERLNGDDYFTEWNSAPEAGVWGGEYNSWGTVWDTIGYVDSGFSSDWFAQDTGLDAPGVDFELAYNHVTFDNYYPGLSQRINAYHVETVRVIVTAFMDHTDRQTRLDLEAQEGSIGWVPTDARVTDADEAPVAGWAAENPADDPWERGKRPYVASPNQFFQNLTRTADDPDALQRVPLEALSARLDGLDRLAVPGSAADRILDDPAALEALRGWVEDGGTLFLTDGALQLLEPLGIADEGAVTSEPIYAGHTNFVDRDHPLADGVAGMARQTYEPVPLGFSLNDGGHAPSWYVDRGGYDGTVVGVAGSDQSGTPEPGKVNLGQASLGDGEVAFLGALLPDPSTDSYHPYGLDGYATTYTGKQITYNALGFQPDVETAPAEVDGGDVTYALEGGDETEADEAEAAAGEDATIPAPGAAGVLAALAAALLVRRRR